MLSNPFAIIYRIIHGESGDMEFFYQSSTWYLSSERSDFPRLASHIEPKIVKWLIWRKKLKITRSETKRNSIGQCMNVFLNFDPHTTLDLFHPKQWLQKRSNIKEIEPWKVANRLWNGKMIKKWPMLKAHSVLRA